MAIFTNDKRFEEVQNLYIKGEESTMCDVLDNIVDQSEARGEVRGEFNIFYKQIKKGILTIEQAANSIDISVEQFFSVVLVLVFIIEEKFPIF